VHRYRTHFSIYTTANTNSRTTHRNVLYIQPFSWRWTLLFNICRRRR